MPISEQFGTLTSISSSNLPSHNIVSSAIHSYRGDGELDEEDDFDLFELGT